MFDNLQKKKEIFKSFPVGLTGEALETTDGTNSNLPAESCSQGKQRLLHTHCTTLN